MDPILTLADLESPAPFQHHGTSGTVFPQFLQAGCKRHHSKWFYVEFPADNSGSFYQIDASRLVSLIGDGGTQRHFTAREVATILSRIHSNMNLSTFLKIPTLSV
jgi:hypothetical protein